MKQSRSQSRQPSSFPSRESRHLLETGSLAGRRRPRCASGKTRVPMAIAPGSVSAAPALRHFRRGRAAPGSGRQGADTWSAAGMRPGGAARGGGCARLPLLGVLLVQGVHIVLSLEIKVDAHVRGYVGEKIKLKCTFKSTSSVTDKLTIDWTYRPPSSSRTESIFHYQSFQYPSTAGTFRDRISWAGDVYKGDASISISNPTLKDNGTFSCAVKNPPDVHHNIPMTELTVTERGFGTMLSSVALLSILVFIPSAVVAVLLLVRMGRKSAGLKKRSKSGYKKSSIEVSDDTDQEEGDDCMARLCVRCAECVDSDYEEAY